MRAGGSRKAEKQRVIRCYEDLKSQAFNDAANDIMQQTIAILLYSLKISEKDYSKEELLWFYKQFNSILNMPEIRGERIRSDEITMLMEKELGVDFSEINVMFGEENTKDVIRKKNP